MNYDLKKNGSGYDDPTPYEAIKHIDADVYERRNKLIHTIFHICELAGFELEGRIILRDRKTGKLWR